MFIMLSFHLWRRKTEGLTAHVTFKKEVKNRSGVFIQPCWPSSAESVKYYKYHSPKNTQNSTHYCIDYYTALTKTNIFPQILEAWRFVRPRRPTWSKFSHLEESFRGRSSAKNTQRSRLVLIECISLCYHRRCRAPQDAVGWLVSARRHLIRLLGLTSAIIVFHKTILNFDSAKSTPKTTEADKSITM